jgi:REase_MTES_1575
VISHGQLLDAGVGRTSIVRWNREGRIHRLHPTVYCLGHTAIAIRGRLFAALLCAGPEAGLSHQTAAWHWKLLPTQPNLIHVTSPRDRASIDGVTVHRAAVTIVRHAGLPVTTVARTLLDLAATMPYDAVRRALAEADFRSLLNPAAIQAELGRGRRGSKALRAALLAHLPELANANEGVEVEFLLLCERAGIAIPQVNVYVEGFKVDCLWRDDRVVVELDSRLAHGQSAAVERDRHRDLVLRRAGYVVRRYTWHQVTGQPEAVIADLRAALR